VLQAEIAAEIAYFDVMILFARSQKNISQILASEIQPKHDCILEAFKHVTSRRFIRIFYMYKILCAEISGQNDLACELCIQASQLISEKPFDAPGSQFSFDLRAVSNLIKLGKYADGEAIAIKQMRIWNKHLFNWNLISLYYFILCCHKRDYTTAYKTASRSLNHRSFRLLHETKKQFCHINHAYAHFFLQCGKVELTDMERAKLKKFRIYKFLNEVPIYSKDKRGMNISILIIQILFFVWEKKYKKVQLSINSLSRYCNKYLRDDDTYRSHCFIKMLLKLASADFNPIRGQRYAKSFHEKLLSRPLATSRQAIEVEIVPYEHLWEMILEMCGRNGNGTRSSFPSGNGAIVSR